MKATERFGRSLGLTLLAAAIAATWGCSKREEPKKEEPTKAAEAAPPAKPEVVVKIGHAGPLTGAIAHLGKDNENGVRLAVDQANDKKMEIDGKIVRFEVQSEDDQADPKTGTTVAQKLVDAKVAGVVGHLNSGVTIPASAIYNQAGIPMISGSATNPKVTEQGFKGVFRTVGRDDQQGPAVALYMAQELKVKKVAIVDDATAYGQGLADEVEKTLKANKVQILTHEKTNDKATDFKAILTKIKGRNPDTVFYGGMDATGGPMLKQARELGIKALFTFGDGVCTTEVVKLAGEKASEGLICSQPGIPTQATSKAFLDAFTKKYGEVKQYAPFTFDAANLLIEAMKQANSVDPAKYLPTLQKISFEGATGKIEFDDKGDRKNADMTIFKLTGGQLQPLAIVKGETITPYAAPAPAGEAKKEEAKGDSATKDEPKKPEAKGPADAGKDEAKK